MPLRFDSLLNAIPVPAIVADVAGVILDVNGRFLDRRRCADGGLRKEDWVGRDVGFLGAGEESERWRKFHSGILHSTAVQRLPAWRRDSPSGETFYMDVRGQAIEDEDGVIVGACIILDDVTAEVKRLQDSRRLDAIRQIGDVVLSSLDLSRIASVLAEQVVEAGMVECMSVAAWRDGDQRLEVMDSVCRTGDGALVRDHAVIGALCAADGSEALSEAVRSGRTQVVRGPDGGSGLPACLPEMAQGQVSYLIPVRRGESLLALLYVRSASEAEEEILRRICLMRPLFDKVAVAFEHALLFEQLQHSRTQLKILSRRLVEAQEAERRYIARELHDSIGQTLTVVKLNLQAMAAAVGAAGRSSQAAETIGIVDGAMQQVRDLSLDLRPSLLDDLGLAAAVQWYLERQARAAGWEVQLAADIDGERLPRDVETASFRVAQEALTNVMRHARASHVDIALRRSCTDLFMEIRDDGVGFDVDAVRRNPDAGKSLGLLGMEERVLLLDGQIAISSATGGGACVSVRFPLAGSAAAGDPGVR